jgi:hypothetical protein
MNPLIQLKNTTPLILLAFVCFGLLPTAKALLPPPAPDGGYPGGNTAEGQNALHSLTSGGYNTAIGFLSLYSNTQGSFNTAIGAGTLLFNTGDNNTATGGTALLNNTYGSYNTATGVGALSSNTSGPDNTANGYGALHSNTTGGENTAVGTQALFNNTTGLANTAVGDNALISNTTGSFNIALGIAAGSSLTSGSYNIDIGATGVEGESNTIRIGDPFPGSNPTATYIAGIAGRTVGAGGTTCYVDNNGKLGVLLSARKFKTDIADMGDVSQALLALRPVTFHYKPELDKTGIPQFGLIAEEVAKANPDLVTHDAKGELSTVRYEAVNAMLLNEFLKEHLKNEEQGATIARQQEEINALKAELKEQASQIQIVSAQLELNKPAPQTVKNDN